MAEAKTVQCQTTINQKAVAIAAETVVVAAKTAAAIAVAAAAAMAMAAMGNGGGNGQWWQQCGSHGAAAAVPAGAEAAVDVGWRSSLVHLHNR